MFRNFIPALTMSVMVSTVTSFTSSQIRWSGLSSDWLPSFPFSFPLTSLSASASLSAFSSADSCSAPGPDPDPDPDVSAVAVVNRRSLAAAFACLMAKKASDRKYLVRSLFVSH